MNENNYLLIFALAGAMNNEYLKAINFLNQEVSILKELFQLKRIPLSDDQRRILAAKFNELDKSISQNLELLVTPQTMMLWYKKLIAQKWDYSNKVKKKRGRTPLDENVVSKVLEFLRDNPEWGDDSISNRLKNISIFVSETSIANIRKRFGIPPVPKREKTGQWDKFLKVNFDNICSMDFKTIEVMNKKTNQLDTYYLLFAMIIKTRKVKYLGLTLNPNESWMVNKARDLTDPIDGFFKDMNYCIIDNDPKFCKNFKSMLYGTDERPKEFRVESKHIVRETPNMNAYIERFNRSYKEAIKWVIPQSDEHLHKITQEWVFHYNHERNHQGLDENIIEAGNELNCSCGKINKRTRNGGTLNYYYRKCA